jgi:hypothetical protein
MWQPTQRVSACRDAQFGRLYYAEPQGESPTGNPDSDKGEDNNHPQAHSQFSIFNFQLFKRCFA